MAQKVEQRPLKQKDLSKCAVCDNGVMYSRAITFYRVRLARMVIDTKAVQRQHGLEMMLSPAPVLASVMGPNEDMAVPVDGAVEFNLCDSCAMEHRVCTVAEVLSEREEDV